MTRPARRAASREEAIGVPRAAGMRRCTVLLAITISLALARPPDEAPPFLRSVLMPRAHGPFGRFLVPRQLAVRGPPPPPPPEYDWVAREIDRLNLMVWNPSERSIPEEDENPEMNVAPPSDDRLPEYPDLALPAGPGWQDEEPGSALPEARALDIPETVGGAFALTPQDEGFNEPDQNPVIIDLDEFPTPPPDALPPRAQRQNPNLGRARHLVAENLEVLRASNTASDAAASPTSSARFVHVEARPALRGESLFGVAVIMAIAAALTVAVVGLAFGWYSLSKKAKAAASVDYPAYGVTGPASEAADRKLAQSAHMFHFQHQKQQILAMERGSSEGRHCSLSDPESEEENEEGDYTVYECPGFASTGDMEVKNPMFSEEPTPATPGNCELVKPQPKE